MPITNYFTLIIKYFNLSVGQGQSNKNLKFLFCNLLNSKEVHLHHFLTVYCVHHLIISFNGLKRLASQHLTEWTKHIKISRCIWSGKYDAYGRHSDFVSVVIASVARTLWNQVLSCCYKHQVHVVWTEKQDIDGS